MLPMFYKSVSAVSLTNHQDACVEPYESFGFAAESNAIAVGISEFAHALSSYPIIFVEAESALLPMVVTGLRDKQNQFVTAEGSWQGAYIPAYVRRYPFVVAEGLDGVLTVCVDEGYPGFNREGRGESLFAGEQQTPYLIKVTGFLQDYEREMLVTKQFTQCLKELELLEDSQAIIERPEQDKSAVGGFKVVSRERLNQLSAGQIQQLQQSGYLELIYQHLISLQQFSVLLHKQADS